MNLFDQYSNEDMFNLTPEDEKKRKLKEIETGILSMPEDQPIEPINPEPVMTIAKAEPKPVVKQQAPKEVNKEVNKAIEDTGVKVTPEQKKFVKANWNEYDRNIHDVSRSVDRDNKLLSILEAASGFFTAGTGVKPDSAFYDKLRQSGEGEVQSAKEQKMSAISNYYKNKDAERQFDQDKRQGEMDAENKRRWEIDDAWRREKDKEDKAWREKEAALNRQNRLEDRQLSMTRALQEKQEKKELADIEKKETLGINYGDQTMMAKTPDDAKVLKEGISGADKSISDLKDVMSLGKNVSILDRTRVNQIQQKLMTAIGGLRLSVLGPGVMTDSERAYLRENIGDPTMLFSTEGIQNAKLQQLIDSIEESKQREIQLRTRQGNISQPGTQTKQQQTTKKYDWE